MPDPLDRLLGGPDPSAAPRPEFTRALLDRLLAELAREPASGMDPLDGAKAHGISSMPMPATPATALAPDELAPQSSRLPPSRPATATARRWALGQLATAALLLLTLGLGYVAFRTAGPNLKRNPLPAVLATPPATPTSAIETMPLMRLTLTATWTHDITWVGFSRATYAPGGLTREVSNDSSQLFFIEAGSFTVHSLKGDLPTRVAGGDLGATATSSVGDKLRLVAGDALLLPAGSTVEIHNESETPATILYLMSALMNPTFAASGMTSQELDYSVISRDRGSPLPPPPLVVTLDRVDLAAGTALPPPPEGGVVIVGAVAKSAPGHHSALRTEHDLRVRNAGSAPLSVYVLTVTPAPGGARSNGTPAA